MTHKDSRVQELVELLHGAIRSLSDREVTYDVCEYPAHYGIQVNMGIRGKIITINKESMYGAFWDDIKRMVVQQFILGWCSQLPAAVRAG